MREWGWCGGMEENPMRNGLQRWVVAAWPRLRELSLGCGCVFMVLAILLALVVLSVTAYAVFGRFWEVFTGRG